MRPEEGRAIERDVREGKKMAKKMPAGEDAKATKDHGTLVKELGHCPAGPEAGRGALVSFEQSP